jgi:hypothetical protein
MKSHIGQSVKTVFFESKAMVSGFSLEGFRFKRGLSLQTVKMTAKAMHQRAGITA